MQTVSCSRVSELLFAQRNDVLGSSVTGPTHIASLQLRRPPLSLNQGVVRGAFLSFYARKKMSISPPS